MAGEGKRFKEAGYTTPKPFIEVEGKTMLEWSLESLVAPDSRFILIARASHLPGYESLMENLKKKYPITLLTIDHLTEGMVCTTLIAAHLINNEEPLLLGACDQTVDVPMSDFISDAASRNLDGSLMTFHATHPKWSYSKVDENGFVTEEREKNPISTHANVGFYYFAKGKDFVTAAALMIAYNERVNNEFYVAPAYNYAIAKGAKIGIYEIQESQMHGLGTPDDVESFKAYRARL